jgi:predicted permease
MSSLSQHLRYAFRQLNHSRGFAITAVLTLALGIGANVAVFSVMNAVLLNPSGVPNPDRMVAVRAHYGTPAELGNIGMSPPDFADAEAGKQFFSATAAMTVGNLSYLPDGRSPERLVNAAVSWQFFDAFLAKPVMGRTFRPEEDVPDSNHVVLLSYPTWKKRFGGDPNIIGRKITLNQQSYEVVGVMGAEFGWPNQSEVWTPLALKPERLHDHNYRYNEYLFVVSRMKAGVSIEQVNEYLAMKARENANSEGEKSYAKISGWGMFSMPLLEYVAGDLRKPLSVLLSAVILVLLIACANIAGLQLARASDRQRETSIRIALGAGRKTLLAQAFTESAVLSFFGVALGLILARTTIPLLLMLAPESLVKNLHVQISVPVLLYVIIAGVLCAIFCGVGPAYQMTHVRWFQALQESGRSETSSKARQRLRSAMVVGEIALAMLLLVSSGLLVRSLRQLERVDTGFEPRGLMSASLTLPRDTYKADAQQAAFALALETQLQNQAGVTDAALVDALPFSANGGSASFEIVGQVLPPNAPPPHGNIRSISPAYFSTLKIPLVEGRFFNSTDQANTQKVAIIDETLARDYWPGQDPLGKQISFGDPKEPPITIVGLVKHARVSSLEQDNKEGIYYLPLSQAPSRGLDVVVRTSANPTTMADAIRNAVRQVDSNQAVYDLRTLEQLVDSSLVSRRFMVVLLSTFAGLALLLSALGLYGVISYGVHMRLRELGIRMALGAGRSDVLQLVLRRGMEMAAVGLIVGLVATFLAGRVLSSMLFATSLFHPLTLLATSALLTATVLLASYLPARRASKLDPMRTLREE